MYLNQRRKRKRRIGDTEKRPSDGILGYKTSTKGREWRPKIGQGEEINGMEADTRNIGVDINVGPGEAKQDVYNRAYNDAHRRRGARWPEG